MLFGRIMTDGRLNARVKCDLSENLILKANAQVINRHMLDAFLYFLVFVLRDYCVFVSYRSDHFVFLFQLSNEPHMSHGMANFDYKVNCFYLLTSF